MQSYTMEGEDEKEQQANVKLQFDFMIRYTAATCFVAAPTTIFCHAYVICYILGVVLLILLKGDFTDPSFITNLFEVPMMIFAFYFGFYVLQERELRRFNQEQRAVKKEG